MLTRRVMLRGSAVVIAGAGAMPGWLARAAESADSALAEAITRLLLEERDRH